MEGDGLVSHVRYSREVHNIVLSVYLDFGPGNIICDFREKKWKVGLHCSELRSEWGVKTVREGLLSMDLSGNKKVGQ